MDVVALEKPESAEVLITFKQGEWAKRNHVHHPFPTLPPGSRGQRKAQRTTILIQARRPEFQGPETMGGAQAD